MPSKITSALVGSTNRSPIPWDHKIMQPQGVSIRHSHEFTTWQWKMPLDSQNYSPNDNEPHFDSWHQTPSKQCQESSWIKAELGHHE